MPKYMLLLHGDPTGWVTLSPEEMQKGIEKYVAWGRKLREAGILDSSHKLADEPGKVMRSNNTGKIRVSDGPYSETKEVLGGYYIISADNYEQAIERSRDCPQLEWGGTIEVRQIDLV